MNQLAACRSLKAAENLVGAGRMPNPLTKRVNQDKLVCKNLANQARDPRFSRWRGWRGSPNLARHAIHSLIEYHLDYHIFLRGVLVVIGLAFNTVSTKFHKRSTG